MVRKSTIQLRVFFLQLLRGFDAVVGRHGDVEHDHVGVQCLGKAQRLRAVCRLADHLEIGVGLEQRLQAGTDDGVVVSDQDANRQWCLHHDSRPCPGALSTVRIPPSASARSFMPSRPK